MYNFISHRGNDNKKFKENTKKALLTSIKKNYVKGIEFDIRITKDNEFIINHNPTIIINNKIYFIKNLSSFEIRKLNIKYHLKLCFLDDILKKIKTNKYIIIEIKEEFDYSKKQIDTLINIINKYNLNIILVSFNYKLISKIKKHYFKCGLLIGRIINRNKDYSIFPYLFVTIDFYQKYKLEKKIFIWTINSIKDLKKIDYGNYIITDVAYKLSNFHNHH